MFYVRRASLVTRPADGRGENVSVAVVPRSLGRPAKAINSLWTHASPNLAFRQTDRPTTPSSILPLSFAIIRVLVNSCTKKA